MGLALLTLVSVALSQAALPADTVSSLSVEDEPVLKVWVDEANHEVVIEAGPFHVPAKAPGASAGDHMASMHHHSEHERSPLMRVAWPVEGWLRGFSLTLRESDGSELPLELLHHFVAVNFSRRQLVYPVVERLFAVGQETTDVLLPPSIGVPVDRGAELGFYAMWSNTLGRDLDLHLETRIPFLSADQRPQMDVLPLYMDVNNVIGETSTFDLPPGESTRAWEFEVPVAGRVLMMGGHLHDYGRWVRLEDAETDEVLVQVNGHLEDNGKLNGVERKILGFGDNALRLEPNHRYRVVGAYDNLTDETIPDGGMAHLMGIFVPDDFAAWPAADEESDIYKLDLSGLPQEVLRPTG